MTLDLNSIFNSDIPAVVMNRIVLDLDMETRFGFNNQFQNPHLEYMYGDVSDYVGGAPGYWSILPAQYKSKVVYDMKTGNKKVTKILVKSEKKIWVPPSPAIGFKTAAGVHEPTIVSNLVVDVDFSIHSFVKKGTDLISSWVSNQNFLEFYRIRFIVNIDVELYKRATMILSEAQYDMSEALSSINKMHSHFYSSQNLTIHDTGLLNLGAEDQEEYIDNFHSSIDSHGNKLYEIPFHARRIIDEDPFPEHLSIFAIPYLDLEALSQKFGMDKDKMKPVVGTPVVELVINNGESGPRKRLFKSRATGLTWTGPVHQVSPGNWSKGCHINSNLQGYYFYDKNGNGTYDPTAAAIQQQRNKALDFVYISNYKIQDFRPITQLKKAIVKLAPTDNPILGMNSVKLLTNDNLDASFGRIDSFFSDICVPRDHDGNTRFLFSVDYLTLVREKSAFKTLFNEDNEDFLKSGFGAFSISYDSMIRELLAKSAILNIKIFRKRVETRGAFTSRLEVPKNFSFPEEKSPSVLVAQWTAGDAVRNLGTVDLMLGDPRFERPYMYHFTGKDSGSSKLTHGIYFYELEMEILDGTVEYAENILQAVISLEKKLKEYYSIAVQHNTLTGTPNYNMTTRQFIPEFIATVIEKIPEMAFEVSRKLSLRIYLGVMHLFFSHKQKVKVNKLEEDKFAKQQNALLDSLVKITNPVNGSPEGIKLVLQTVQDLIANLERSITSLISGPAKKEPANAGTA